MLVRLMPEQISSRWDIIKQSIVDTSPPYADVSLEAMNNVLMSLLNGSMQCWVELEEEVGVIAILTTAIEEDFQSKTKNLLIYSIYAYKKTSGRHWAEGFDAIKKFASSEGCKAIIGITKEEKIIRIVERFGGDAGWRYLRIPIPDNPTL